MPQVRVVLDKWLEGQVTLPSIVARVYPLGRPQGEAVKPQAMMIPAGPTSSGGPNAQGVAVDLPVGKYLVEAYLPNGDVATVTISVHEGANAPVELRGADSPHEWLSWQHLTGYAPSWEPSKTGFPGPVKLDVVTSQDPPKAFASHLLDRWKGASLKPLRWKTVKVAPGPGRKQPMVDRQRSVTAYLYKDGKWEGNQRYFGLVRSPPAGPPLLAVLPLPWHQADFSGDAPVDVVVDAREAKAKGREWPLRVSVLVRDKIMASVFGYLSSGDLAAAGLVMETAVNLLYQKGENALAAAGGAYALVGTPLAPQERPVWVPWLQNLRNRFPWLPDGAILDGWAHLNGIGRPRNALEAATAFVAAAERGLPFYSAGVRLLFEGFTRVEALLEAPARPTGFAWALEFARRLALRVDVRQPFTVVRLV